MAKATKRKPPISPTARRRRIPKEDRPLYDSMHPLGTPAHIRWQLRRDTGLTDVELNRAIVQELSAFHREPAPLIPDTLRDKIRLLLEIPYPPPTDDPPPPPPDPTPPPDPEPTLHTPAQPPSRRPQAPTHAPPFLELHPRTFHPPTLLGATFYGIFCVDREHPQEAKRAPHVISWEREQWRATKTLTFYQTCAWPCGGCQRPMHQHRCEMW